MTDEQKKRLEELEAMDKRTNEFKEAKEEYEELKKLAENPPVEEPKPIPVEEPVVEPVVEPAVEEEEPAVEPLLKKINGELVIRVEFLDGGKYVHVLSASGVGYKFPREEYDIKVQRQ